MSDDLNLAEIAKMHAANMSDLEDMNIPATSTQKLVTRLFAAIRERDAEIERLRRKLCEQRLMFGVERGLTDAGYKRAD